MTFWEKAMPLEGKLPDLEIEFNPSTIYLFKEKKANIAYKVLNHLLNKDYEGFCITRFPPNIIRERYDLDKSTILWLTGNKVEGIETLAPTDIGRLASIVTKFIDPNGNGAETKDAASLKRVIILDDIEYLIMQNDFQTILRVLHLVRDKIMLCPAIMLLPIDPLSIDFKELRLIEHECEVIDVKDY
jgi:hypothetical protein